MQKFGMATVAFVGISLFGGKASASLISLGAIPSTGNGIGAVNTSLTFQNTGSESGCVAFNGTTATTGAASCPTRFTGGDEKSGNSQINVFTATDLGFNATTNFSNLVLLFNGNEGGNAADQPITLDLLGLSLYSSTGIRLATFTTTAAFNANAFPGIGNAGFGFGLDATEAAEANALLAANPTLRIGTEANASGANGGPETIQLTTTTLTSSTGQAVAPEPFSLGLVGASLLCIGFFKRRLPGR